ncbi:MAG: MXAN_5808 family serine peptidase [Myxococcota bacterium]
MIETMKKKLKRHGRFLVAALSLAIAFVLSVQFSDRGVQFDLQNTSHSASKKDDGSYDLSALQILNRVLLQIKENYVEPDRVEPNKMLVASLDEIQNSIAEVVVNFEGDRDAPSAVTVMVGEKSKTFEIGKIESLWEMSFRLKEIFRFVEEHLEEDEDLDYREIEYAAINGMLSTLDPHSTLLPPRHYEEMQTQTGGKFGGLGIVISIRDGQLTVISPIDDTPASRKGIKAKDKIVRIGDESTVNMNLNEAVNMLRGEPGTEVSLWIMRKPWTEPREFTVTRAIISIESVETKPLDDKVGYVRIKNFQANTHSDLVKGLDKLKKDMGGMQGLVLDMRDNPGGLLDQAIKVSDTFLNKGVIVSTVGVGNTMRDKKTATRSGTEPDYPIVVLVNAGSASASEIVAGALQNNNRGLVVGDTTFGKGSVQVLYEFNDNSALKLTIAQYLTPGDSSIQGKGITPDLRLVPVVVSDDEIDMFLSDNILREEDLNAHLSNEAVKAAKKGQGVGFIRFLEEVPAEGEEEEEFDTDEFEMDFQIEFASQLVTAAKKTYKRPKLLEKLQDELNKIAGRELDTIIKDLKRFDIDWTDGTNPSSPKVDLTVSTSRENNKVSAGESIEITAKLENNGDKALHRVKAITRSANSVLDDREYLFGKIEPGQTREWKVTVDVPKDVPTRHDMVEFTLSGPEKVFSDDVATAIMTEGHDRPHFAFSYTIDDKNGDGVLQNGEDVDLKVVVENNGKADSSETQVLVKNKSGEAVYLNKGRETVESIAKGESEVLDFAFSIKELPKDDYIELELTVLDTAYREFVQRTIKIPFSSSTGDFQKASGVATVKSGPAKLFVSSNANSDTVAMAKKDAKLPVVGELQDWLELDLGDRNGWIQKSMVDLDTNAGDKLSGVDMRWFQAPRIDLNPAERMTSKKTVKLEGKLMDDATIKDYYIFVYNREDGMKTNSRKLDYTRVGSKTSTLSTKVPLFEGMNRVTVVSRDEEGMETRQTAFVYRK